MKSQLKLAKSGPITERKYPHRGVNPDVEPASFPFKPTKKQPGDLIISSIGKA